MTQPSCLRLVQNEAPANTANGLLAQTGQTLETVAALWENSQRQAAAMLLEHVKTLHEFLPEDLVNGGLIQASPLYECRDAKEIADKDIAETLRTVAKYSTMIAGRTKALCRVGLLKSSDSGDRSELSRVINTLLLILECNPVADALALATRRRS